MRALHTAIILVALLAGTACSQAQQGQGPEGFDTVLLQILACPEDKSSLRLATPKEIESLSQKQMRGDLQYVSGGKVEVLVKAALIREDQKIGYLFEGSVPVLLVEKGVLLKQ